jgi:hypothetical protein
MSAIYVDVKALNATEIYRLAYNDGFENLGYFTAWFGRDFKGKIIHWTDLRY